MALLERLSIRTAGAAAAVTLHNYVSERSVALLLRPTPTALSVGSGTCVQIRETFLIATAGHNFDEVALDQIEVLPRGSSHEETLPIVAGTRRNSPDVGWLELEPDAARRSRVNWVDLRQLAPLRDDSLGQIVALVQGYPAKRVVVPAGDVARPSVESDGFQTLVIPRRERSSIKSGVNFSVEYPPWDGSVDKLAVPDPFGASGGGVWQVPIFQDGVMWAPEQARLMGVVESWQHRSKELFCVRIEQWLSTLQEDRREFTDEIESVLSGWRRDA